MYDYVQIVDKKLCYNQGYIVEFFLLGDSLASEFCADVSEHTVFSIFIGGVSRKSLPAYTTMFLKVST